MLACFAGACGDGRDLPTGHHGKAGRGGSGHAGAGGVAGVDGTGGAAGGQGGRGSPMPLPPPASNLGPDSLCELDGWCWFNPLPSGANWSAVAGAGRTELWIAGGSHNVLHFDGGRWTTVASPLTSTYAAWAASETDVWFVGIIGGTRPDQTFVSAIAHWDGVALTLAVDLGGEEILDVWGANATDVYAVAREHTWHWDGSAWTILQAAPGGRRVSGSGSNDVWIASLSSGVTHFDGTGWSRVPELEATFVQALAVIAPDDVWALVSRGVQHFDGVAWSTSLQLADTFNGFLEGIAAAASDDVWVVGTTFEAGDARGYLNHYDGRSWQQGPLGPGSLSQVRHVAGVGNIAVGFSGGILRLASTPAPGFTDLRTGPIQMLSGVFGSAPTDMWAVGDAATALHYDGRAVSSVVVPTTVNLTDVWGSGPNDVWIVGAGGTVLRFDGLTFTSVDSGTTADLNAVFMARPNDVWIGGAAGALLHWDGSSMATVPLAGASAITAILDIHGLGADDIWLSGRNSTSYTTAPFVAHFDGASWSPVEPLDNSSYGSDASPSRIWELAPDDVWIATESRFPFTTSVYRHFDGASWTLMFLEDDGPQTFMFPRGATGSFIFGPHDRWLVDERGTWMHNRN